MKRILSIQDLSCMGKVSLSASLPVLSVMGLETAVMPTAVFSGHTAFQSVSSLSLEQTMPSFRKAWQQCSQKDPAHPIRFDGILCGYLAGAGTVPQIQEVRREFLCPGALTLVDPAMADHGKLYRGLDPGFPKAIRELAFSADVIVPNLTEACLLNGSEYKEDASPDFYCRLAEDLCQKGPSLVVITGYTETDAAGRRRIGAICCQGPQGRIFKSLSPYYPVSCFGTGDLFASVLFGALILEKPLQQALDLAAGFTGECIRQTLEDPERRWYGTSFEKALPWLLEHSRS